MNRLEPVLEETILKAMQGDEEAFTELYKAFNNRVFFLAMQFFRNEETAKDIVQEVFIKVHNQIHTLKVPKAFSSWLHVVTYRECHNATRRKKRVFELGEDEQIENFEDSKKVDVIEMVENERINEIIMESLETMKAPLRTVAVLRFYEELKVQEIADIMGTPKSTVSTRLVKIKKVLQENLVKNGINKNLSIIVSPILIREAYELLSNRYKMNEDVTNNILNTILTGGATGGISLLAKMFIGGLTTATVLGGAIYLNQDSSGEQANIKWNTPQIIEEVPKEELAEIANINYDSNWRNSFLQVEVETTNDNYDKIIINGVETLNIESNGNYIVELVKDDETIDQREITISNIDKESPTVTSQATTTAFTLYLEETVSGVNWDNIQHYKNGELVNDYVVDSSTNTIIVNNDFNHSTHELFITDNAGNILNITIE